MSFKENAKKTLLSTFFSGTYREYKELKQRELEYDELKQNNQIEQINFSKELNEIELEKEQLDETLRKRETEKEQLNVILENKEQEIQAIYSGHQGLMDEINFLKYRNETLINLHDETVEKYWTKDDSFKKYTCLRPFENIEILPRGEVYTCCSAFVKHNHDIGNINIDNFDEIWNSKRVKQLRYSVSMGDFEYCNSFCRELKMGVVNKPEYCLKYRQDYNFNYKTISDCKLNIYPKQISLSCDESCNLYCSSCRNKRKVLSCDESIKLYDTLVAKVLPLMKDCEQLSLLGSGDFFASHACMNFVKHITSEKFPKLCLYIGTNAQLFNKKNWIQFENLNKVPIKVAISIDSTNKETYEKLRRGGNWKTLLENLEYIKYLKQQGQIYSIRFNFVVQLDNFRQMKDFVVLAQKYNVDEVWFQRMSNWGTISQDEFSKIDVFDKNNPYYSEAIILLEELKNNNDIEVLENCL